jgi:Cu-Zn family superoxide dismutase
MMNRFVMVTLALLVPAVLGSAADEKAHEKDAPRKAICILHPTAGSKAHGRVVFTQMGEEIAITGEIRGLTPGEHAFHVHEFGDCSAPDAMSAGSHFNPTKMPHGSPDHEKRHVGDLGNIKADDDGKAVLDIRDKVIQLHGPHSILGRSIIVHAKPHDFSQPVGNAGGRVACGVIGVAKP